MFKFSNFSLWSRQHLFFVATVVLTPMLSTCTEDLAEDRVLETEKAFFADIEFPKPRPLVTPVLTVRELEPGYTLNRIVGLVDADDTCPGGNEDWEALSLSSTTVVHGKTKRFCGYRWAHAGTDPNPDNLPMYCTTNFPCCVPGKPCPPFDADGDLWLAPDDTGLFRGSLPTAAKDAISHAVQVQHHLAMGTPPKMPKGHMYFTHLPRRMKVYVLDDSEDRVRGLHGDAVAKWIKTTSSASGTHGIWMHKRNVFDSDGRGSIVALAQAIEDAVADAAGWPAIINLSLELHPKRVASHGSLPDSETPVIRLKLAHLHLESALKKAACKGIPVIAAAGNRETGDEEDIYQGVPEANPGNFWAKNVSFPAAFGRIGMGNNLQCPNSPTSYSRRLAYAAGGINYDGSNSPSTRINGQTCLVTPSGGLTADGRWIEGTSFSAAAMTGAAAAVMRYSPLVDGHEAMRILRLTSEPVEDVSGAIVVADACEYEKWGEQVRRVNMCAAIKKGLQLTCIRANNDPDQKIYRFACGMYGSMSCSAIQTSAKIPVGSGPGAVLGELTTVPKEDDKSKNKLFVPRNFKTVGDHSCPGDVFADGKYRNDFSCPDDQLEDGMADADRSRPSPGGYGCGGCAITVDGTAVWLLGTLTSEHVTSPTVSLGLASSSDGTEQIFELGDQLAHPGDGFAILLSENAADQNLAHASFSYQVEQVTLDDTSHHMGLPVIEIPAQDP